VETNRRQKPLVLDEESKRWLIHGPRHTLRNVLLGTGLLTLFCILLLAKLSATQAYAISGAFICMAGYAIYLGFRD
jgi:hypothetical protein